MTTRLANTVVLVCIALFGVAYLTITREISAVANADSIGPAYMPLALGVLLLVFCVIAAVREYRSESTALVIENKTEIACTVVLTAIYFASWEYLGHFYLVTTAFFMALVVAYTRKSLTARSLGFAALYAVLMSAFLYVVFDWALEIRFI